MNKRNTEMKKITVSDDLVLEIPNGKVIKENFVGKNMANYDSMLVLSHFKGHPMGGYGGALKQLSIGCASSRRKIMDSFSRKNKRSNNIMEKLTRAR